MRREIGFGEEPEDIKIGRGNVDMNSGEEIRGLIQNLIAEGFSRKEIKNILAANFASHQKRLLKPDYVFSKEDLASNLKSARLAAESVLRAYYDKIKETLEYRFHKHHKPE